MVTKQTGIVDSFLAIGGLRCVVHTVGNL